MSKKKHEKSPLMQRITDHFDLKKVRTYDIPDWGENPGEPLKVYIKPTTVREKSQFVKDVEKWGTIQAYIKLIIVKALDEQGKNLFTIKDEAELLTHSDTDALMGLGLDIAYNPNGEKEDTLAEK